MAEPIFPSLCRGIINSNKINASCNLINGIMPEFQFSTNMCGGKNILAQFQRTEKVELTLYQNSS